MGAHTLRVGRHTHTRAFTHPAWILLHITSPSRPPLLLLLLLLTQPPPTTTTQPGFRLFVLSCLHLRRPSSVPSPAANDCMLALDSDGGDSFFVYATSILCFKRKKLISAACAAWKPEEEVFCVSHINAVEEELRETNREGGRGSCE